MKISSPLQSIPLRYVKEIILDIMINIYILKTMYEWDEHKNELNQKKHGISFENARYIFDGLILQGIDTRFDYQETRFRGIGLVEDLVIVVIYTTRKNLIRIISARLANQKERGAYYEAVRRATK